MEMEAINIKAIDWRQAIKTNRYKALLLIMTFLLVYIFVGLILDLSYCLMHYAKFDINKFFPIITSFQIRPYITILMLAVAITILLFTLYFPKQLMLTGTTHLELNHENAKNLNETIVCDIVDELSIAAGLTNPPKIIIIEANFMNAFVSGINQETAFIAVTRGLITKLKRNQLEGVIAHELSHIKSLDIRLTVIASILSHTMVNMIDNFFSAICSIFTGLMSDVGNDKTSQRNALIRAAFLLICVYFLWPLFIAIILLRVFLPPLNSLLLLFLNRTREYMADDGAIELLRDSEGLSSALVAIQTDHADHFDEYQLSYSLTPNEKLRSQSYIFDPAQAGFLPLGVLSNLLITHPKLKDRLTAIGVTKRTS